MIDKCKIGWIIDRESEKSLLVFSLYTGRMLELKEKEDIEEAKNQLLNKKTLKTISYSTLIRIPSEKIVLHKNDTKLLYADTAGHIRLLSNDLLGQYNEMNNLGNITREHQLFEDLLLEVLDRSLIVKKYSNGTYNLDDTMYRIQVKNLMVLKDYYKSDLNQIDTEIINEEDYIKIVTTLLIPLNNTIQLLESLADNEERDKRYDNLLQFGRQLHKLIKVWLDYPESRKEVNSVSNTVVKEIMYEDDAKVEHIVTKLDYIIYNFNQVYK